MRRVNIHEAKTHLSRLVEEAAKGEPFIIAKAGKPMVKVVPIEPAKDHPRRQFIGCMEGEFVAPSLQDFNAMDEEIARLFNDGPILPDRA
jgi:prevent-host-death family protein